MNSFLETLHRNQLDRCPPTVFSCLSVGGGHDDAWQCLTDEDVPMVRTVRRDDSCTRGLDPSEICLFDTETR